MHPIFIQVGGLTVHTYGLLVAIGFMAGLFVAVREAKRVGIDPEAIGDLFFWIVVSAIAGSRLFYVAIEFRSFLESPIEVFKIWKGGLVFYGGLIAASATTIYYIRRKNLPVWRTADILAPSLAIGQVFGRLGCFSAGCCYGRTSDAPWAVVFTNPDSLAPLHVSLHPTQLYESGAVLFIFLVLRSVRKVKRFEGQLMWIYLVLYSGFRFLIENYRGDPRGVYVDSMLSTSQIISIMLGILGLAVLVYFQIKSHSNYQD